MTEEEKQSRRLDLGNQIKSVRKSKGLSVRELSDLCGVTYQNINKIEIGCYNASVDVVNRILVSLGCRITIESDYTTPSR